MNTRKKVLIIDDHEVVRNGIKSVLELRNTFELFEAASKLEAQAQIAKINPDAIVVDLNLPDGNGLEIVSWARSISSILAIVVLTFNENDEFVLASLQAGASAFVNKSAPITDLIAALDHALIAPTAFSAKELAGAISRKHERFGLSQRELQILSVLHRGDPTKSLAASLFISETTLKTHLSTIYRKLQVKNRVQAIAKARAAGLT
ncbi:MAG: DNA-binding response regulator [Actinobacteria bacterium]|jgi:DNA-binding NarL/FixJ family response regulator|nr:DNA-binding response regulator [Actinomycetota bacterium]